jgi:WD40 repeat protein
MNNCPSTEQLRQLLAEQMGAAERDGVEAHVEGCAACQGRLEELTAALAPAGARPEGAAEGWSRHEPDSGFLRRLRRRKAPAAPAGKGGEDTAPSPGPETPAAVRSEVIPATRLPGPGEEEAAAVRPVDVPGYEVLGELGRGGMGVVYKARQANLNRLVALKMILSGVHAGAADLARFRTEAQAIARLQHPHIVQVHEVGEHDGLPYFSLEFCAGGSLEKKLGGTPLAPKEAAALVAKLAQGMHAAHQKGVIHRDLKPANVLLTEDGTPKVTDFGLARQLDEAGQTASGAVMGTPSYMAPEQAGGKTREVGPAADVYALGAILYQLLTGRPPFKATTTLETLRQVLTDEPVPPGQLQPKTPRDLETICLKCLHKVPRKRYASALELAEDLHRYLEGVPIRARPISAWERLGKWTRRRPAVAALLALSLLASVVVVGLLVRQWQLARVAQHDAEARAETETRAKQEAEQAQQVEAALRKQTGAALGQAQTHLYLSNAALAHRESVAGNVGRTEELLNECPLDHRNWEWYYLKRQLNSGLLTLVSAGRGTVNGVAFSPDGKRLATAEYNEIVKLWDAATGKELLLLNLKAPPGGHNAVNCVAFSPDGLQVVTGSEDGTVRFWDATTGKAGRILRGHGGAIMSLAFRRDGQRLASASTDKSVKVWDTNTGQEVCTFRGHKSMVTGVTFSPDGKSLASVNHYDPSVRLTYEDLAVRLWDATTGQELRKFGPDVLNRQFPPVTTVAFRPDGKHLAAACTDYRVLVWDVQTGRLVHTLSGHTNSVVGVAYSPDGNRLATASQDRRVKVWSAWTYQEAFTLHGHAAWLTSVAFSADSRRLAAASRDGTVKVWDATAGPEAVTLVPAANLRSCFNVAFSPDGRKVVSATEDNTLRLWDLDTGKPGLTLGGHPEAVKSLAFSLDGKRLASADAAANIKVWDAATGQEILALRGPTRKAAGPMSDVSAVAFALDGQLLAWAGHDGTIKTWDSTTGREVSSFHSTHSSRAAGPVRVEGLWSVALSHDGRLFASFGHIGHVKVWEVLTGKQLLDLYSPAKEPSNLIAFSRDGRSLASAAGGQEGASELTIWDLSTGQKAVTFAGPAALILSLAFSPDGRRLASVSMDRTVKVWDVATGRELLALAAQPHPGAKLAFSAEGNRLALAGVPGVTLWDATPSTREVFTFRKHNISVFGLAFSPDSQLLASCDLYQMKVCSMSTGREVLSLPWDLPSDPANVWSAGPGDKAVPLAFAFDVAFSPDGQQLAASGGSSTMGEVRVWDRTNGRLLHTFAGHKGAVPNLAFRPDGQRLASASSDKTVKVWDLATGREVLTLAGHTDRVRGVAFSPDGKRLASGGKDKVVKVWEADTGREMFKLEGHTLAVARVAFSPDGRHLASASGATDAPGQDGEVKVWDVSTGQEVLTFRGHSGGIFGVAYSPDGRLIASGGVDRTVRLWEAATGREVRTLHGHLADINRVAYSPDGRFIASAGEDSTVRVWDTMRLDNEPGPRTGPGPR